MDPAAPPLVSVITPARDMERYIRATMHSVLAQTLTDFEYLVVDNGSTDGTLAVIEEVAAGDDRVRVLHERRPGSGAARNRALAEARGRFVAFVDADDVWLPTKLHEQVAQLQALPARYCGVFCRSVTTDEDGTDRFTYTPPAGTYDLRSFRAWFYPAGNGSSFLMRHDAVRAAGGFDEDLDSLVDVEWVLRVLRDSGAPLFLGTADVLVRYRRRPGSVSTRTAARMQAMETVLARFDAGGDPLAWLRPALMAYRSGCPDEGRRWASRAGRYGWHRLVRSGDGRRLLAFHLCHGVRRRSLPVAGPATAGPIITPMPSPAPTAGGGPRAGDGPHERADRTGELAGRAN